MWQFSLDDIFQTLELKTLLVLGFDIIFDDIDLNFFTFTVDVFSGYNSKSE